MSDQERYRLNDQKERELAAATFDQNIVVTAGAGTGKTSLLVNRLVHLLMREPDPVRITEIVSLTFTNKAANEMKARLREELESYIQLKINVDQENTFEEKTQRQLQGLMARYRLSKEDIDDKAAQALRQLERSDIGTIHSFAATLLRLYPLEAGVDPGFDEGEETAFEKYFEAQWADWLAVELSHHGPRKDKWKKAFGHFSLEEIHDLALGLCSENVPLNRLDVLLHQEKMPAPIQVWLEGLETLATGLNTRHSGTRNIEILTQAAGEIIREVRVHHRIRPEHVAEAREEITSGKKVSAAQGWEEEEVEQAKRLVEAARRFLKMDVTRFRLLHELIVPFVVPFRDRFLRTGAISFDGLLVRARNLVRDCPWVREALKRRFRAILIDEFQDTDPVQYEILLYLSEVKGENSKDWRKLVLEAGKLFVVGDPKQSIYGFRRADIAAYLHVVRDLIEAQGGIHLRLTTNFRSHEKILNVVNSVFEGILRETNDLQPPYVGINPPKLKEPGETDSPSGLREYPFRTVALRCVRGTGEIMNAALARRLEGEAIARWLSEEVLGKAMVLNKHGEPHPVQRKDVAVLMRTLSHVHEVLEPLKRKGIRYVVEGEKRFFASQEVVDAVNLLRAIANPEDTIALVGVLRSALGGFSDAEIYTMRQKNLLNYGVVRRRTALDQKFSELGKIGPVLKTLYLCLDRLHQEIQKFPVDEAVARIFAATPMMILAAESLHGEQAVANLEKIRRMAGNLGEEGRGTFREVVAELERSVKEVKEEGENPLAEETVDAVKILSIHKAKGLEFPVVVLAGCHSSGNRSGGDRIKVFHDWFSDLVGLRVGETWDPSGIYLAEKENLRKAEEQKRVLYVAMTRAREHLMISCAPTGRGEKGSFLAMLSEFTGDLSAEHPPEYRESCKGRIETVILREGLEQAETKPAPSDEMQATLQINWEDYADQWNVRKQRYDETHKREIFVTPTSLKQRGMTFSEHTKQRSGKSVTGDAARVGQLAHRFLQDWDFSSDPESFREVLTSFLRHRLGALPERNRSEIRRDLEDLFHVFLKSGSYETLCQAKILGREIPFLISWEGRIMEGVIDLIYEKDGKIYVVDYKTDRVKKEDLRQAAEGYRHQARIYPEAVRRSLQRELVSTRFIFLRTGEAIEM
ncbi:MAG: UvrD-helicase domain-containing protein [Nitrospiria bacterium]